MLALTSASCMPWKIYHQNQLFFWFHQALVLLEAMWEAGGELAPDTVSYNAALKACGSAAQICTALQVLLAASCVIHFMDCIQWYVPAELSRRHGCLPELSLHRTFSAAVEQLTPAH